MDPPFVAMSLVDQPSLNQRPTGPDCLIVAPSPIDSVRPIYIGKKDVGITPNTHFA